MPALSPNPPKHPSPERRSADSVTSALLLAFTGGSLDAFLYLNHGRVFAGAMTGNAVLSGIALLSHKHHDALHHLLPIAAFIVGVWGEQSLEHHIRRHAVLIGLSIEISVLFAASWLPQNFPDLIFVPLVSFVAAYQVASFRTVDEYSYNSTFITGNLRTAVEALHAAISPRQRANALRQFRDLGLIIVFFIAGAVGGALLAGRIGNHTLCLPIAALLLVLVLAVRRDLRSAKRKSGD